MKRKILFTTILALVLNFIVESFSRRSVIKGVVSLFTAPYVFLLNTLIIAFTLSFVYLFRRRKYTIAMVSLLWILASVVDFVLLFFRKTPFTANDFMLIGDAIKVIPSYINLFGIVLMVVGFLAAVVGMLYYWRKSPVIDEKINYIKTIGSIGILWFILYVAIFVGLKTEIIAPKFGNITTAYNQYGFAYCFTNSIFDNGISKPDEYTDEELTVINEAIKEDETESISVEEVEDEYPNVIFLQLESFMDPYLIKNVKYSEEVIPYFSGLFDKYPSGFMSVPSFGAGTANTEFEIITGMNLDDFGTGEYPFKTILKNQPCESICYNLKPAGYTTHAIHNNDGSFYSRYKVYANLGFDDFTSVEYMGECDVNPIGWAKDKELTNYILKALNKTEGKDLIYTISVQGHGDYPSSVEEIQDELLVNPMKYDIKAEGFFDEDSKYAFEYYLNQIKEMDDFLESLIRRLSLYDEDIILVIYGDHLPGFDFTNEDLYSEDIYKSEYIIWSNYDAGFTNRDLESFQLSSYILKNIGIKNGVINLFHQKYNSMEDYLDKLTVLEYDVLYGDKKIYGNQDIYVPTDMKMGLDEISISKCYVYNDNLCVEGSNYNKYSYITVNGKEQKTYCVNPHTLITSYSNIKDEDVIAVVQHGDDGLVLSQTEDFIYHQVE